MYRQPVEKGIRYRNMNFLSRCVSNFINGGTMDRKNLFSLLMAAAFTAGSIFCSGQGTSDVRMAPDNSGIMKTVEANNRFALDFYKRYSPSETNIFFSPYSISAALAMTYEGAGGKTAEEMAKVFYFPLDEQSRRQGYMALFREINRKDKKYKLSTANALWAQKYYSFLREYFDVVGQYYGGSVKNMDFKTLAEESRKEINRWVEKETNDKIKDIIPSGVINALTKLILTNAVYFRGEWIKQFDAKKTLEQDFMVSGGKTVKVPIMERTGDEAVFPYSEDIMAQVLEMPYSGDDLSMLVLLPKDGDMKRMENALSLKKLQEWQNALKKQRVEVFFPKFKLETKYSMSGDLAAMGMPSAFSGSADFSGMTGRRDLCISDVIHKAYVEVNEEGTEAAAATAVIMKLTAMPSPSIPVPVFRADRPFIFIIRQKATGNILFMGRVRNPLSP